MVLEHIPPETPSWNDVMPQQQGAIFSGIYAELDFVHEDMETRELRPSICHRTLVEKTIIRDAKKGLYDGKAKYSHRYKITMTETKLWSWLTSRRR